MSAPAAPVPVERPSLTRDLAIRARAAPGRIQGQLRDDEPSLRLDRGPTGERFVTYVDSYGDFQLVDWLDIAAGDTAVWDVLLHLFRDEGVDPQLAVLFTSFETPGGDIYYFPLANDVVGTGEATYDRTADHRLEGYVFMNDVPYWIETPERTEQAAMLFNQEIGHRFGVFVRADLGEGQTNELLGRDLQHWSYFVDTGASPMEGNAWVDNRDGTFTTATPQNQLRYHSLDLYLMGLLPADEVEDTFVIRPVAAGGADCFGFPLGRGSVPQFCGPKTILGVRRDFGVADIIAVQGPRVQAWPDTPDRFDIAFVLVARPADARNGGLLRAFDELVDRLVQGFHTGTGGRAELIVVTASDGCGCHVAGRPAPRFAMWMAAWCLGAWRARRRR